MDGENCFLMIGKKETWKRPRRPPWWRKRSVPKRRFFFAIKTECPEVLFLCVKPRFTGRVPPKGSVLYKLRCSMQGANVSWAGRFYLDFIQWVVLVAYPTNICSLLIFPDFANKYCSCVDDWKISQKTTAKSG